MQLVKKWKNLQWPEGNTVTKGVTSLHDASTHSEQFERFGVSLSGGEGRRLDWQGGT